MNVPNNRKSDSSVDENEKSMPFNCSVCGKKFSNEKRYFGHLRIHSGELSWSCDKCPPSEPSFDTQSKLATHENLCHALVRPHKCSICDDVFDRASQLDYHERSVHLGEKSQMCQICGKGFFRKTDLQTHLNIHLGTNQSICEICGRKFNHVSNLIRHCRTHAGSKPYPCTICGKRFTQISSLARHKRIHSRESSVAGGDDVDERVAANDVGTSTERKTIVKRQHYCRICGESFRFLVLLRQHFKIHSKKTEDSGVESCAKNREQETSDDGIRITEQTSPMLQSAENPEQSSAVDWEDFHAAEKRNNIDESRDDLDNAEARSTDSIRDHLLELDRKMNAIEIDSERDVSISISDILSPYDCDEIELSSADGLETNLHENQTSANKQNVSEKDYDIAQCLNGVDFASNVDSPISETANEKISSNIDIVDRRKFSTKDQKNSKSKPLASLGRDQYNKCLHVDGGQLYIEISESDYLKNANLHALELQDIENVALLQEVFDLADEDATKCGRTNFQKIDGPGSSGIELSASEAVEPSLRLVQTETGEQFYELIIDNQRTENFVGLDVTEDRKIEFVERVDVDNVSRLSARADDGRSNSVVENSDDREKSTSGTSRDELFPSVSDADGRVNASTENDESMPMVRLVQNEDGEQFFELVREPSEYERNREDLTIDDPRDVTIREIPSGNFDDSGSTTETKPRPTTSADPEVPRDRRECTGDNARPAKDRTRKFQCTECDKWFSTAYNCKQHAGTHFSDQQKFQCKHCGTSFAWKSTLNKHLAINHRPDGPQKFVCKICPKVYSTLSQVNEHVKRDHLKERNHVCSHCGKTFFKKFDLKTHSRTHTDERPYVCRCCGKSFHHQSHIIRHERIHTGERPYACEICQKSFAQPSALRTHRQRHRDVKIDILEYRMDDDDPLSLAVQ